MTNNITSSFRRVGGDKEFIFPVFKFLSQKHAEDMIKNGNFHLPTLYEFRDKSSYKGKILDIEEGKVSFSNHYDSYEGLAKNADGLLPLYFTAYQKISVFQKEFQKTNEVPNVFIYCVTQYLFSDALKWAIEEKKDTCVLITDFDKLLSQVTASIKGIKFNGVGECLYIGREIKEKNPGPNSLTNYFLSNNHKLAYLKPEEYKDQREIRAIWHSESKEKISPITKNIQGVSDLTIQVDISGICFEEMKKGNIRLGARIHKRDNKEPAEYALEKPFEFFTPVIYKNEKGPWHIGFLSQGNSNVFSDGHIKHADIAVDGSVLGPIFCCVELENVKSIEFLQL